MALAMGTAAVVLVALLWELARPSLIGAIARRRLHLKAAKREVTEIGFDPGRERRAELRARALLRSCIEDYDWAMYRDLGFLRVWGSLGESARVEEPLVTADPVGTDAGKETTAVRPRRTGADSAAGTVRPTAVAPYAYLIYPHRPIIAYLPETGVLLNEYCVAFPDHSKPYGSARLPDSDDVLAKWMALTADERRVIADANMHLPGRQIDPDTVRRDLLCLSRWERERDGRGAADVERAA
jgi:hypothetical protein